MSGDFCVRIVNGESELVKSFKSELTRNLWLCSNDFYPVSGCWKHMDGRVAGKFMASDKKSYDTCLNKIVKHGSMWDSILRDKNVG